MKFLVWGIFFLASAVGGCSHVMSEGARTAADTSISYADINRNPEAIAGKHVIVGGIIENITSDGDVMTLEVTRRELLSNGIPDEAARPEGRFLVVSGELLDPRSFRPGLLITVAGEIKGQRIQARDGVNYRYPLISAREMRLFRATDTTTERSVNPYKIEAGDQRLMIRPPAAPLEDPLRP